MMTIASAAAWAQVPESWVDAVAQVETGGEAAPDSAVGDGGKAKGRFQFHKPAWTDCSTVRKAAGLKTWPYAKATDPVIAREYARTWLTHLRERITAEIGRPAFAHEVWLAYNLGFAGFKSVFFQVALVDDPARYAKAMKVYNIVYSAKLPTTKR